MAVFPQPVCKEFTLRNNATDEIPCTSSHAVSSASSFPQALQSGVQDVLQNTPAQHLPDQHQKAQACVGIHEEQNQSRVCGQTAMPAPSAAQQEEQGGASSTSHSSAQPQVLKGVLHPCSALIEIMPVNLSNDDAKPLGRASQNHVTF